MKIVILGAGASYDCMNHIFPDLKDSIVWRPPLGNELFGKRKEFRNFYYSHEGARALSNEANTIDDIENFFQDKWNFVQQNKDADELFSKLINTQYYLQQLLQKVSTEYKDIGGNNYDILLGWAYEYTVRTGEEVAFITFNYDLLLEYAFRRIYANKNTHVHIEEYIQHPIKIFKPHGSCNWVRAFKDDATKLRQNSKPSEWLYYGKVKYDWIEQSLEPKIHAIPSATESGVIQDYQKTRAFFPQILIPLKEKDEFVMPKEHEDEMVRMLKKASEILVIGWKGSEAHFLNCLKENIGEKEIYLTNITGESNSTIKELKAILPNLEATMFLEDYFESHYEGSKNVIDMQHEKGTFSSYIMNVSKVKTKGFFDEK